MDDLERQAWFIACSQHFPLRGGGLLKGPNGYRLHFILYFLMLGSIACLFLPNATEAAETTLAWNPNSESNVVGYKLYYGTASRNYSAQIDTEQATNCNVSGLAEGTTYYFSITAYDTSGKESGYSNEVSYLTKSAGSSNSKVIPKAGWKLRYVDSQEVVGQNGAAANAFDGNVNTFWHTAWYRDKPSPPHEIQIDLGGTYNIDGFGYLPRQDGGVNGRIGQYEFYVSADGVSWGSPVAAGVLLNNAVEKQVSFAAKAGRYVRLKAVSEVNGNAWTSMAEINILGTVLINSKVIPKAGWKLRYVDSQEVAAENGAATNAFDGNVNTFWHTAWYRDNPRPPHEIQIDLGGTYNIDGFGYLSRQDGGVNGRIGQYEFYVSADGVNWGKAAAGGVFSATKAEQAVSFPSQAGRYVRLRALSEVNGNPWTSLAELNVLGGAASSTPSNDLPEASAPSAISIRNLNTAYSFGSATAELNRRYRLYDRVNVVVLGWRGVTQEGKSGSKDQMCGAAHGGRRGNCRSQLEKGELWPAVPQSGRGDRRHERQRVPNSRCSHPQRHRQRV